MNTTRKYGMDAITEKLAKGQYLSEVEKRFMEDEAGQLADKMIQSYKNKGPAFVLLVAKYMEKWGNSQVARAKPASGNLFEEDR